MTLTIGSLFSGIGGLELGLEWAGLGPVLWQCEINPFCRDILAKHWPNVQRYTDVTTLRHAPHVDLICGGFPCQDVSSAGKGRGIGGQRSGLWRYFAAVVDQVRPRFVVVENVASGARRWLPTVRRDLHVLGYDSAAYALSAADVGAPFLRRRVFAVAWSFGELGARRIFCTNIKSQPVFAAGHRERPADPWRDADRERRRVDDGRPRELDRARRVRALGNAVVPQCAEVIGRIIADQIGGAL